MKKLFFSAEGRIGRATYWKGTLISVFGLAILSAICNVALSRLIPNEAAPGEGFSVNGAAAIPFVILNLAVGVAGIWSTLCLGIKRYHDRGKSGVWVVLIAVPLANLWYLVETGFLTGTAGPNAYGPDPLAGTLAGPSGLSPAI